MADSIHEWSAANPLSIGTDEAGNVFVFHGNYNTITKYGATGNMVTSVSGAFDPDTGSQVVTVDGKVMIKEASANRVRIYDGNLYFKNDEYISVVTTAGVKTARWMPGIPFDRVVWWFDKISVMGMGDTHVARVFKKEN